MAAKVKVTETFFGEGMPINNCFSHAYHILTLLIVVIQYHVISRNYNYKVMKFFGHSIR